MKTDGEWIACQISDDALERQAGTSPALVPTLLLASYCFTCKTQGIIDAELEPTSGDDLGKGVFPSSSPRRG
jgi:hypothetical protein